MKNLANILSCKCPNCKSKSMFDVRGNIFLLREPKMLETCSECGYKYVQEPGFYIGAMYVSYALGIMELVAYLVILWGFLDLSNTVIISTLLTSSILTCFYKYRLSRSIWSAIFYRKNTGIESK